MRTKINFTIVLAALLAIAALSATAWAKKPVSPGVCPAGLAGTWAGGAGSDIHWLATQTSGSLDPTKGEMILNWTYIKPSFPGGITSGVTLTPGHGVWQLNADGDYDYTWYAYAIDPNDGSIAFTIRVSGVAKLQDINDPDVPDCDTAIIDYNFEIAEGEVLPWELGTAIFQTMTYKQAGAGEIRVPLTVTPLPEP